MLEKAPLRKGALSFLVDPTSSNKLTNSFVSIFFKRFITFSLYSLLSISFNLFDGFCLNTFCLFYT